MVAPNETVEPNAPDWQSLLDTLKASTTLASLVLSALQIGLWVACRIVERELDERAQRPQAWSHCAQCGRRLESKGFIILRYYNT